jgi:hypothetical protein
MGRALELTPWAEMSYGLLQSGPRYTNTFGRRCRDIRFLEARWEEN